MESIWTLAQVGQLESAATSTLLAIKAKQRSIYPTDLPRDDSGGESEAEEEDDDDDATSRPTPRLATNRHDELIDKFLDRLAEVFSHEKSFLQSSNRQDSEHVAATAWIRSDAKRPLTVIVAKNRGFLDERDVNMLARLKRWLRIVAVTGCTRLVQTDSIWAGDGGLVEYSRGRLWYHISQIKQIKETPANPRALPGDVAVQIADMQNLCRNVRHDSPAQQFSSIVNAAYDKRSRWKGRPVQGGHRKAVQAINMLGRLRAAYECFKSVALTFDDVRKLEMQPTSPCQHVQINTSLFQELLQKLSVALQLPKGFHKSKAAYKYKNASSLHIHAEMQILVSLGQNHEWHKRAHPYIGVSKKLCFLCDQILQNYSPLAQQDARRPTFKARPCHDKIYPLWTLPQCTDLICTAKMSLATAVTYARRAIRQRVQQELKLQPAKAESTAAVTDAGSLSEDLARLRDQHLADQRPPDAPKTADEGKRPGAFGRKIKTVKVGIMPANGTSPRVVPITFHALSETAGHRTIECGQQHVPNFRRYWREHQFDRRLWNITFENQANESWNGKYRLYWNENPALPENETVKRLLGENEINPMRRFWHGDVFVMKYSEHPETSKFDVHDLPFSLPEVQLVLQQVLRDMWEKTLETELEQDRLMAERQEKFEADKEILLQRM